MAQMNKTPTMINIFQSNDRIYAICPKLATSKIDLVFRALESLDFSLAG